MSNTPKQDALIERMINFTEKDSLPYDSYLECPALMIP
jgi:hypothetical protein